MKRSLLLFSLLILIGNSTYAQELARRAFLGVRMGAVTQELKEELKLPDENGAYVSQVFDASSAKLAGLEAGDVLVQLGEKSIANSQEFIGEIRQYETGDKVDLYFYRAGKREKVKLELMGFPKEKYEGAILKYGSVKTSTGIHRSILSLPEGKEQAPVIYIIQGIDCGSIDVSFFPQSGIAQLVRHFTQKGFATYRVEKSGVGDSKGKACGECDFEEDKAAFLAGIKTLKSLPEVDEEQVYLLGLSMGGVWAPLLAKEVSVKGIMAYGTISRPLTEYMLENSRRQAILAGADFSELEMSLKNDARLYHYLFSDKLSPREIMNTYPELAERIREISSERDAQSEIRHIHAGRLYTFQEQLHNTNIAEAWKQVDAHVLAVWGKGDYVSNREDHELIRDIVNHYHPGKATFVEVEANHWFEKATSEQEAYQKRRAEENIPLNPEVFETFSNWISKIMG